MKHGGYLGCAVFFGLAGGLVGTALTRAYTHADRTATSSLLPRSGSSGSTLGDAVQVESDQPVSTPVSQVRHQLTTIEYDRVLESLASLQDRVNNLERGDRTQSDALERRGSLNEQQKLSQEVKRLRERLQTLERRSGVRQETLGPNEVGNMINQALVQFRTDMDSRTDEAIRNKRISTPMGSRTMIDQVSHLQKLNDDGKNELRRLDLRVETLEREAIDLKREVEDLKRSRD